LFLFTGQVCSPDSGRALECQEPALIVPGETLK